MKNYIIILLLSFLFINYGNSQKVHEDDVNMSLGIKNALYLEVDGADKKMAEKTWKKFIKDYGKTKKKRKEKEWQSKKIVIPAIQRHPVDLYVRFEDLKQAVRVYLWVDLGDGFLNTVDNEKEGEGAEVVLQEYHSALRKKVVNEEVEDEENLLKNKNKELQKLAKKKEDYLNKIEKLKNDILKYQANIEKNGEYQVAKQAEIEAQQEVLSKTVEKLNAIGRN